MIVWIVITIIMVRDGIIICNISDEKIQRGCEIQSTKVMKPLHWN